MSDPSVDMIPESQATVIVGAGSGGLLAAFYNVLLGHDVTVLEGRSEYKSRQNLVFLQEGFVKQILRDCTNFYELGYDLQYTYSGDSVTLRVERDSAHTGELSKDDEAFIQRVESLHGSIAINEIQEFLEKKIAMAQQQHPAGSYKIITHADVKSVDQETSQIHYLDGNNIARTLQFDNLVIAEGAQRELTNSIVGPDATVALTNPDKTLCGNAVGFMNVSDSALAKFAQLQAQKPVVSVFLTLSVQQRNKDLRKYKDLGWTANSLPIAYITADEKKKRFYIACEIPPKWQELWQEQLDILKRDKNPNNIAAAQAKIKQLNTVTQKWFQEVVTTEYPGLDKESLTLSADIKLQMFKQRDPTRLKEAYMRTNNGANIFFVADALMSSVYKLGIGHAFAGLSCKAMYDCFDSKMGKFVSGAPMQQACKSLDSKYFELLRYYDLGLYLVKMPLTAKHIVEPIRKAINNLNWMYRNMHGLSRSNQRNFENSSTSSRSSTSTNVSNTKKYPHT